MDRPKRYVAKPQRYQTTNSDETPQKKVVQRAQVDIEDDAEEIRRILEDKECDIHNSVISYPQMHSQSHMQPQTHSQPHMQSQPHTLLQPHTQSQPLMPSQLLMRSQSRTYSQPNMPSQQHMDSLPHTYLQEHVDSQPHIHSQTHTQSQPYAQNELQLIHYTAEIGGTNVNADLQSIMERMHNE
ncbi:cip1-interacting zinc finger protein-like [Odontomachus brunneus]|uniref:cip1-interacting zinc finger protein-like n=1 Tax=Odontomachus brunneus TaxID=486640 RepID=UPI0013F1953F|nr:cip1-interacting zinc finger protein-like [Odontomachus brunneus]